MTTAAPAIRRPAIRPFFGGNMPVARLGLVVNGLVPAVILLWDGTHGRLGADPTHYALHTTGIVALIFLILSLAVTPVKVVTGFSWLIQFRRSLGLYAFFYAVAHLLIYFWFDRGRNLQSTVYEILHRNYLLIGFSSLALMAPLAATSYNAAIRAMGGKNWKLLHRWAYVAAVLGCVHFYMQSKADKRLSLLYAAVLATLLSFRLLALVKYVVAGPRSAAPLTATGRLRFWKGNMKVAAMFDETPSVRTFQLTPEAGGKLPFDFSAGQFLNLTVDINGKKVGRSYTIASPPTREDYLELTIKRESNGQVSKYLHEMLTTGQGIAVSAPAGRFTFDPKSTGAIILVAGGVGITPVMSILRDLTDRGWPGVVDLVFSVKTPADVIFEKELKRLAAGHPNVHIHITVTRDAGPDWTGPRGRITAEMLTRFVPDLPRRAAFICGPNEMAAAAKGELQKAGVEAAKIKVESFTPAAAVAADTGKNPAETTGQTTGTVTFEASARTAEVSSKISVLEAAESVGVSIDYDCRSGICGRCRVKLLDGRVTMAVKDALTDADIDDGYILACQAHATDDVIVDA